MAVLKVVMVQVHDADGYAAFVKVASAAMARHGGEIIAESEADVADRVMVQRFEDAAGARAFLCDAEVQQALDANAGAFTRDVVMIERP